MMLVEPTMYDLLMLSSDARPDEIEQFEALVGPWSPEYATNMWFNSDGIKFALVNDSSVAVCAGGWHRLSLGNERVYQGWMVGTMQHWERYWRSITKFSRIVMNQLLANGAYRLQVGCLASRESACEWYERGLLMQREAVLGKFGRHGEDMVIFRRLKESGNG
jgi:hypothetical protein